MTKRQIKAKREYVRQWRAKYPKKARAASDRWKEKHPGWWRGPKLIQWLTTALINGNADSTVFREADCCMDVWIDMAQFCNNGGLGSLSNGSKLSPIKHWREFDLNDPEQVKQFLAPGNFKLVSK